MAAVTTTLREDAFSFPLTKKDVMIDLGQPCEVRCHKIFLIEKTNIRKKISKLHPDKMEELSKRIIAGLMPK